MVKSKGSTRYCFKVINVKLVYYTTYFFASKPTQLNMNISLGTIKCMTLSGNPLCWNLAVLDKPLEQERSNTMECTFLRRDEPRDTSL